jgi:hypothetical protein
MVDDDSPSAHPDAERFGFAWDIAMGLREVVLYWGRGKRLTLDDKMILARQILDHLRISGVVLSRKLPLEGHGRRASDEHRQGGWAMTFGSLGRLLGLELPFLSY